MKPNWFARAVNDLTVVAMVFNVTQARASSGKASPFPQDAGLGDVLWCEVNFLEPALREQTFSYRTFTPNKIVDVDFWHELIELGVVKIISMKSENCAASGFSTTYGGIFVNGNGDFFMKSVRNMGNVILVLELNDKLVVDVW